MRPRITHPALRRPSRRPPPCPHHLRLSSSSTTPAAPPPARPYRAQTDAERAAQRNKADAPAPPPPSAPRSRARHLLSKYLNPFHEPAPAAPTTAAVPEPRDPARGIAAAERVVAQGVLDPRYKAASRRWIAIILSLVVAIGLTPEVWRRTMRGEKRKEIPVPGKRREVEEAMAVEGDGKRGGGR